MECKQVRDKLTEFIDNEVSDTMQKAIQTHLDNCADCFREIESLRGALSLCRNWSDVEPSKDWDTVLKRRMARARRQPETELEILRSAVIGLSRRIQKLEEIQGTLPPTLEGEIMTLSELSRYLRISADKIHGMIDQIPKFQIGYEYRFVRASVDQWIRSLEQYPYPQSQSWKDWSEEENE